MLNLPAVLATAGLVAGLGGSIIALNADVGDGPRTQLESGATPAAAEDQAQVADLQTRVADLSTRVAELGGVEAEALVGRLGGSRSGYDARYGPPVAYLGGGVVQYEIPDFGRLTVPFEDGVAQRAMLVSPRPAARPLDELDPADWTAERAREIAATLVPTDAAFSDATGAPADSLSGQSAVLTQATTSGETAGCDSGGQRGFTVAYTMPDANHVSEMALTIDEQLGTLAPTQADRGGRSQRGANAVANSSLGGVVAVNGLRLQAFDVIDDAEGNRQPAAGQTFTAVELAIENDGRRAVRFDLSDFILVDASGDEVIAVCGGVEPALGQLSVGQGETAEGWITFQVPEGFVPGRLVILGPSARVGFSFN